MNKRLGVILSDFYRAFEDRYRGPRETIKRRLDIYRPSISAVRTLYPGSPCLDLGCGRGEWLEILVEMGLPAHGIDLDNEMLECCQARGLSVEKGDVIELLKRLPDESQAIVSGFHIAEHLNFDSLQEMVKESHRVLKPGGLLILETPNPENIIVGSCRFYLDPTHNRPLPPELLAFIAEFSGFIRSKIIRLQEDAQLSLKEELELMDVLGGVSPDYAVLSQKDAGVELLATLDFVFDADYGLTLQQLSRQYQQRLVNLRSSYEELHSRLRKIERLLAKLSTPIRWVKRLGQRS